jgi:hypothetical protein
VPVALGKTTTPGQAAELAREGVVSPGLEQGLQKLGARAVAHPVAGATVAVVERLGEDTLPHPDRAAEDDVLVLGEPLEGEELADEETRTPVGDYSTAYTCSRCLMASPSDQRATSPQERRPGGGNVIGRTPQIRRKPVLGNRAGFSGRYSSPPVLHHRSPRLACAWQTVGRAGGVLRCLRKSASADSASVGIGGARCAETEDGDQSARPRGCCSPSETVGQLTPGVFARRLATPFDA